MAGALVTLCVTLPAASQTTICHYYNVPANGPIPNGTRGAPYQQYYLDCCDGLSYNWILGGTPPPGLTLRSNPPLGNYEAWLEGTPTAAGLYNFTVTAFSVYCGVWVWTNSIQIDNGPGCGTITLSPQTLPRASYGVPYSKSLTASGGVTPYAFALVSGSLPPGLTLSTAGVLSGIPTYAASYSFLVGATDASGCIGYQPYALLVTARCAVSISPPTLPDGTKGAAYRQLLSASGGTAPYTFSSGALPPGIVLGSAGVLYGTPTQAGLFNLTVSATDGIGCVGQRSYQLAVGCGETFSPTALPGATAGQPYVQMIQAFGGTAPYSYSVASGSLPAGMLFASNGILSGTPTMHGSSPFTVMALDATGCSGYQAYVLAVRGRVDVIAGLGHAYSSPNRLVVVSSRGTTVVDLYAFAAGHWGITISSGDLYGDLTSDLLAGPGPGPVLGPHVRAFDEGGVPHAKVSFYAYGTLSHGVNATAEEIDRDAFDEIVTGPGAGQVFGPHVRGWNFDATAVAPIANINYFAYATLGYGAVVAAGDLDGDLYTEILTAPGPGPAFAPLVRGWYYRQRPVAPMAKVDFEPFATPQYGADVRAGDVEADTYDEIACTPGPGPSLPSQTRGFNCDDQSVLALPGFDVTPFSTSYGARLSLGDLIPDGRADLLCGAGPDPAADTRIKLYVYTGAALQQQPSFLIPFGSAAYGVDVATGGLDW